MPADQIMVQGMAKVMVAEVNIIIATVARCVAYGNILNFALGAPIIGKYIYIYFMVLHIEYCFVSHMQLRGVYAGT